MGKFESIRAKYINKFDKLSDEGKMSFLWMGVAALEGGVPLAHVARARHPEVTDLEGLKALIVRLDAEQKSG
jgi:hypothetical protein